MENDSLPKKPTARTSLKTTANYDNSKRLKKSQQTQQLIIETMVQLLVERRGGEVQFFEIAKASGVSERTIFRFFKDKKSLLEATDTYVFTYVQVSMAKIQENNLVEFARKLFILFDEHENLVMAYLYSPFGQQARILLRKKFNQMLVDRIMDGRKITSRKQKVQLGLITTLFSARIWEDIRLDYGFTGEEIGDAIADAIQLLIAKL